MLFSLMLREQTLFHCLKHGICWFRVHLIDLVVPVGENFVHLYSIEQIVKDQLMIDYYCYYSFHH